MERGDVLRYWLVLYGLKFVSFFKQTLLSLYTENIEKVTKAFLRGTKEQINHKNSQWVKNGDARKLSVKR